MRAQPLAGSHFWPLAAGPPLVGRGDAAVSALSAAEIGGGLAPIAASSLLGLESGPLRAAGEFGGSCLAGK